MGLPIYNYSSINHSNPHTTPKKSRLWRGFSNIAGAVTSLFSTQTTSSFSSSTIQSSTPRIQSETSSVNSSDLSDWTILSSSGEEPINDLLTSWIELDDGYSNKGQRRLAAAAIQAFINNDQTKLDLSNLDLTTLPDIFFNSAFTNRLKNLKLDGNGISSFPPSFKNLGGLKKISGVSFSTLSMIPKESLSSLSIIQVEVSDDLPIIRVEPMKLDFSVLNTWAIKGSFTEDREEAKNRILEFIENKNLSVLDLSNLQLRSLPNIFNESLFIERLKRICLFGNNLQSEGIPKSLNDLKNLELIQFEDPLLNLDSWALEESPGEDRFTAWLRIMEFINHRDGNSLDLSGLNLSSLPHIFSHEAFIADLHSLDLSCNQLTEIQPTAFVSLKNLLSLNLEHNQLIEIDALSEIRSLKEVWLRENNLLFLPTNLGNLSALEWLDISKNSLETLPDSLKRCTELKVLNCSENNIDEIFENLILLENLKSLNIANNSFTKISRKLLKTLTQKGVELTLFTLDPIEIEKTIRINNECSDS